jgi:hypothetical protein
MKTLFRVLEKASAVNRAAAAPAQHVGGTGALCDNSRGAPHLPESAKPCSLKNVND